ncbi:hypothetical protein ACROYT_G002058 [Oculina patagonica]
MSRLRKEYNENRLGRTLKSTAIGHGQEGWRFSANDTSRRAQEELEEWQKQKQDLQSEISRIQMLKNNEEDELEKLRQQKSEMEIHIYDLQSKRARFELDGQHATQQPHELRNARDRIPLTDDQRKSEAEFRFSPDYDRRGEIHTPQNYLSSQPSLQTSHPLSNSYHVTSYNSETSINNSHFHTYQPQQAVSSETLSASPLLSSSFYDDCIKVDNNVTEVASLENRKTILETVHRDYAADDSRTGLMNGHSVGDGADADFDITRTITEGHKDILIQEYEDQIRELRQQKLELEQKVSLLEWQLENMKQKLELQEISHRREISTLNEKNHSFHGYHSDRQDDTLQVFYQRLSYFLMTGEHSNKEIMEEIEKQISDLKQKQVDFDYKNTKEFVSSPTVKLEKEKYSSESEVKASREFASQLRAQMETADNQLKTCEKIIHRLYGENTDLSKENLSLEGKLKSASRSQEKLQRKKILLQKLVDKLSCRIEKDVLKQSYLVLELDKDVSL